MRPLPSGDILCQMLVTCANGEQVQFFDQQHLLAQGVDRDQLEAARLDNLMRLGVTLREEGPTRIASLGIE